jgi:hypothetical protein
MHEIDRSRTAVPWPPEATLLQNFFALREEVLLAFLFGSLARGRASKTSDADVAVLFSRKNNREDLMPRALSLKNDLEELLPCPVDLVTLNGGDAVIAMQVLQYGILVHEKAGAQGEFIARTVGAYEDLKRTRRPLEEALLRHLGVKPHGL